MGGAFFAGLLLALAAAGASAQEWYIPKRTSLIEHGSGELGSRVQLSADNDGLLDTFRLDLIPHVRYAPLRRLELYAELPLAYAEREDVVNFNLVRNKTTGIGDAFAQLSLEGFSGEDWKILYNLDVGFPTGKNPFKHRVPLGGGHYTAAVGQTAMTVIDPVVLFAHLGYQHSVPRRFSVGRVAPGRDLRFRFGSALALNPRVQMSLHVTGDIIAAQKIDGIPQAGSSANVIRLGWGLDWALTGNLRLGLDAVFGMTTNATDATISNGISWSF